MDLIKKFEGFRSKAYKDTADVWTVGYGTIYLSKLDRRVEEGDTITEPDADFEVKKYIEKKIDPPIDLLKKSGWNIPDLLRDSLVSLSYNVGQKCLTSDHLCRCLKFKNSDGLKDWFMLYKWAGGKVSEGLLNRRKAEVDHWYGKIWK